VSWTTAWIFFPSTSMSARIGADQLGHARPSMTQDVYMSRGQVHTEVAAVLDKAVGINDE